MGVVVFLIFFSLFVAIIFLTAFFWAVKSGQYDDPYTPSIRMLFDNNTPNNKNESPSKKSDK